jgi:hypothetical protein
MNLELEETPGRSLAIALISDALSRMRDVKRFDRPE